MLAGSIPPTVPQSMYKDIMMFLAGRNLRIAVDATKDLLLQTLPCHPFIIKPNRSELEEMFGVPVPGKREAVYYAKELQQKGAANVIVSMAGDGAVFAAEDGHVYETGAPEGRAVNSVGAGDSMVAGFLAGYMASGSYGEAFKMAVCTGSASAFSEQLATGEEVEAILKKFHFS